MTLTELRCTNCSAPIQYTEAKVFQCAHCGVTLVMSAPVSQPDLRVVRLEHVGPSNRARVLDVIRRHTHMSEAEADDVIKRAPCNVAEWENWGAADAFGRDLMDAGARVEMSAPTAPAPSRRLILENAGPNKIMVIKVIREHTGLGLAESKGLVDSAPCPLVDWTDAARINAFRAALIEAGATVK